MRASAAAGMRAQAEAEAGGAGVHGAVFGDARIFGVLHHGKIQLRAQAQRHAHDVIFEDGLAVIGNRHRSGALQGREVGQRSAAAAARGGADGKNVDHAPRARDDAAT